GGQLVVVGVVALLVSLLIRRRRTPVRVGALALVVLGVGVGLEPLVVDAYPTSYRRPLVTYHAASIASGMAVYREHCAGCRATTAAGGSSCSCSTRCPAPARASTSWRGCTRCCGSRASRSSPCPRTPRATRSPSSARRRPSCIPW